MEPIMVDFSMKLFNYCQCFIQIDLTRIGTLSKIKAKSFFYWNHNESILKLTMIEGYIVCRVYNLIFFLSHPILR